MVFLHRLFCVTQLNALPKPTYLPSITDRHAGWHDEYVFQGLSGSEAASRRKPKTMLAFISFSSTFLLQKGTCLPHTQMNQKQTNSCLGHITLPSHTLRYGYRTVFPHFFPEALLASLNTVLDRLL